MAHGGNAGDRRRFGRVGAVVGDDFYILGANAAVFLETHLDVDLHEDARPAAGEKFFFAGVDQLDRLARFLRQNRGDQSVVVVAGFAAEAAADCALNDPHLRLGNAQRGGDAVARVEQRLSVHVDGVFAAGGVFGNTADGLDRAVPLGHARESIFDDDVGFGEGLGDVAALQVKMHGDVVRLVVVHQRRAVLHRFFGIEYARKRFPIDFDQVDGFFSRIRIDGCHCRDFFADIAGFADGKNILIGEERAPRPLDRVLGGDDRAHAGKFFGFARIDVADPSMGKRAAQNFADQHAGKINVGDVLGVAGDLIEALDPLNAFADDGKLLWVCHIVLTFSEGFV